MPAERDRTTKRDFVPQIFCQTFVRFLWSASHAATGAMNSSVISVYSCSILLVAAEGRAGLSVVLFLPQIDNLCRSVREAHSLKASCTSVPEDLRGRRRKKLSGVRKRLSDPQIS